MQDYLNSKLYLFNSLLNKRSIVITDATLNEFYKIKKISKKKNLILKTIFNKKSTIKLLKHYYHGEKQVIKIAYKNKIFDFTLNLIGKTQIKNILMSILAATNSNVKIEKIIKNINKLNPINGRFEKIGKLKNNALVILDYAHTPDALNTCLCDLRRQFPDRKVNIVFGCGGDRDKYKRAKMGRIAGLNCSKIYLTDDNPRHENPKKIRSTIKKNILSSKVEEIANRSAAISKAIQKLNSNEILVVAGKGHELHQDYGNKKRYFSDKEQIKKYIKNKNKQLSKNTKINILNDYFGNKIAKNLKINFGSINSKTLKKNEIFFAIKGKKNDGNLFIKNAFNRKAALAIVNRKDKNINQNKQIIVPDTLKSLTDLSKLIRDNFKGKVVAITGSCGKTSLKEITVNALNKFSTTSFSPRSYNNKYGVPLSLFNLNLKNKSGIFEIGMDKKGEINTLSKILKPEVGVITNISYAHAKNFKNIKQIAFAKGEIIQNIKKGGTIILNKDDNFFYLHKKMAESYYLKIISFSIKKKSNIQLKSIKKKKNSFQIKIKIFEKNRFFYVKNINQNNLYNILASIGIIYSIGFNRNLTKSLFYEFKIPEGRGDISRIFFKNKKFFLIDESYNSNPMSMKSAIENFDLIKTKRKKHFLMGDMLELGKIQKKLHQKLSKNIDISSIDKFHALGKFVKETYKRVKNIKKGIYLIKTAQINDLIVKELNNNDYLMIKGSNSTGLNRYVLKLKENKSYAL